MKITDQRYRELKEAIDQVGGLHPQASMRQRWNQLFASGYEVSRLYGDGLNDDHIDTALRRMAREP